MQKKSILFITTADTDILTADRALASQPAGLPRVVAVNPSSLAGSAGAEGGQPADDILSRASEAGVVVLRLLGGKRAMPDTFETLVRQCRSEGIPLIACPGHQEWDEDLITACTAPVAEVETVFAYLMQGGVQNFQNLFLFLSDTYFGTDYGHEAPAPLPWEGIYHPDVADGSEVESYVAQRFQPGRPSIGILFYRAHWMSGNLLPIDALIRSLETKGANVLPVYAFSLKHSPEGDGVANRAFTEYMASPDGTPRVQCIINTMGMSMGELSTEGPAITSGWSVDYLDNLNVPMVQAIVSTGTEDDWLESDLGLGPIDTAMSVALPEFDGRLISVPISFKEEAPADGSGGLSGRLQRYVPREDRVELVARLAIKQANLAVKPNSEKKIALILSNYPTKDARIGNAVGLDTPASAVLVLNALKDAGYRVTDIPETGDELVHRIIERCSNDRDSLTEEQLRLAAGHVTVAQYDDWFFTFPDDVAEEMKRDWGEPPGEVYRTTTEGQRGGPAIMDAVAIAGIDLGNVFVGLQPPRGFGDNPIAIYHSPDMAPTHHYIAYYRWVRDVFGADAILHLGKHGTLEWLPGKGIGLSSSCYPEVAMDDVPLFYPFIINDPGEGSQAKRRAHATIVDHLIPAMTTADSYGDIARVEQLMDEHYQCQTLDPSKLPLLEAQIWEVVQQAELHRDLGIDSQPEDFGGFILEIDGYLCELKDAQIKDGLHILGDVPKGEQLVGLLCALTRLDISGIPSLRRSVAEALNFDYPLLTDDLGEAPASEVPVVITELGTESPVRTNGDVLERIELLCRHMYREMLERGFQAADSAPVVRNVLGTPDAQTQRVLEYVADTIYPALLRTPDEIGNLLRGLEGKFVPPGPSGAPTRGMANILPTGRNFYSVDPKSIPSPAAWETGKQLAQSLLDKYLEEEGAYPEMVGLVVWGTSAMRTHGDDIAQILHLLGVRPKWQAESRRVLGIEAISLEELGRPRIDVTVRISGFFRDAFPNLINLLDQGIELVASLDESPEDNYVVKHLREDLSHPDEAPQDATGTPQSRSLYRIFGSKPGTYGAGILPVMDERNWETVQDLAEVYTAWGGYAYTQQDHGVNARPQFRRRFGQIVVAAKNQDTREHDIFDSDDYMQYHGGMIATVRALTGRNPRQFFGDSSDPSRARTRDLQDEARRVFRSRVVNPKWIDSMKRHGYKGAFELAATVDYMFGYDATAQVIEDWMYEDVTESYVLDPETQQFFQQSNPWALKGIVERLLEAIERGMWENPSPEIREKLQQMYLELEADLEARQEGIGSTQGQGTT